MSTNGSTTCIALDESANQIAVGDALQSVVLYEFEENSLKANEIGMCTYNIGVSNMVFFGDGIICSDNHGQLLQLRLSNQKNFSSFELRIESTFDIGSPVSVMYTTPNEAIVASTTGAVFIIRNRLPTPKVVEFIHNLGEDFKSIGDFTPYQASSVFINNNLVKTPSFVDISLFRIYEGLSDEDKMALGNPTISEEDTASAHEAMGEIEQ